MIDTHCHLDVDAFVSDRDEVLARAAAAGVSAIVVPAIAPATWQALLAWQARPLAKAHGSLMLGCGLGIHPQVVPQLPAADRLEADALIAAITLAQQRADAFIPVVAIGETGLDGATGDHPTQERLLRAHIRAARALGLPVLLHVLRAHDVAPRILREERVWECGGVMHSYSGGPDLVPTYLELGLHISFAGTVTYAAANKPLRAAQAVPLTRLLLETDAPDQAPAPHRGGRNEPALLPHIAAALAAAKGLDAAQLAAATTANAHQLFPVLATISAIAPPGGHGYM